MPETLLLGRVNFKYIEHYLIVEIPPHGILRSHSPSAQHLTTITNGTGFLPLVLLSHTRMDVLTLVALIFVFADLKTTLGDADRGEGIMSTINRLTTIQACCALPRLALGPRIQLWITYSHMDVIRHIRC